MTKHCFILSLIFMLAGAVSAKTLTPAEALARAAGKSGQHRVVAKVKTSPRLVYTASTAGGDAAVYVFADKVDGYMVLSADDVAYPVLGYADKGRLNPDKMAPAMRWWLDEYARQIAWARERGVTSATELQPRAGRRDVPVMIKTAWDQGAPYNQLSPVVSGERAYTGCVATSMAQIMYYFKYPAVGQGKISYNDDSGCGKRLSWNFAEHPFDWDNMLLQYREDQYTPEQAYAVAELIKSAGASVRMSYSSDSSGALSILTANAFTKYFNYDPNITHAIRSYYSATRWDEMIYDNLANVGPVLYGGASFLGGGHSFIVDGYDAETGLFHFNWGWSEMSDGYYALDALNPAALGAGGGEGGGYNFTQDGVFGIQPPTGEPAVPQKFRLSQQGTLSGEVADGKLTVKLVGEAEPMWINYCPVDLRMQLGLCVQKQDGGRLAADTVMVTVSGPLDIPLGYGASDIVCKPVDLSALNLADGSYSMTMSTIVVDRAGETWQPVLENHGYSNSFTLTRTGDQYEITTVPDMTYTVDEINLDYDLYYGCLAKIRYKLTNNNDIEISRGFAPILYNEDLQPVLLGNSKMISIMPGETVEGEIVTDFTSLSQSFGAVYAPTKMYLTIFDETIYKMMPNEIFGEVTMYPNPGMPKLVVLPELSIKNADYDRASGAYSVTNTSNMHFTANIFLTEGLVAYPMYVVILGDRHGDSYEIVDYFGENVFMDDPKKPYKFDCYYNFKSAVPGRTYHMVLAFGVRGQLVPFVREIPFTVMQPSGIEDIEADNAADAPAEYFNLQGQPVDFDNAPAGIYICRRGNKTTKVIK